MSAARGVVELLSMGDRVGAGSYRIHSRFRRAVNLTDGVRMVSVVSPSVGAGPINLVVRGFEPLALRSLRVSERSVTLNGSELEFDGTMLYSSAIELGDGDLDRLVRGLPLFYDVLVELAPRGSLAFLLDGSRLRDLRPGFELSVARHVSHCVDDILHGRMLRGVARLRGVGFGLTPSGDDFIAGMLIAMNVLERASGTRLGAACARVLEAARTESVVSGAFLELASRGRVFESMKRLIGALARGSAAEIRSSAERLLAVGSTSGADIAVGFHLFLYSRLLGAGRARVWEKWTGSQGRAGVVRWS